MARTSSFHMAAITLAALGCTRLGAYSGGIGTLEDPYQIASAQDLIDLGQNSTDYSEAFVLTADIDLADHRFERSVIAPDTNEASISYVGTPFSGHFDGQGHTVRNLQISGGDYLGLFGRLDPGSVVANLHLEFVDINGLDFVGGLAAHCTGYVFASYTTGTVSGNRRTGGLLGMNWGTILSCYSTCEISGSDTLGGLVGDNNHHVLSCYSAGSVSGIRDIGGLAGDNSGIILSSYAIGNVQGEKSIGGLVGRGLGGYTASSFWDRGTSGVNGSDGGEGLGHAQMLSPQHFLDAGWDVTRESSNGTSDYWLCAEGDYPRLAVFSESMPREPAGVGTVDEPYILTDASELGTLWYRPLSHYQLAGDIDLSSIQWNMTVVPWFGGSVHGNGFCVRSLFVRGLDYLGFFGILERTAEIRHLELKDVRIVGRGTFVGSLAGYSLGRISACHAAGLVRGQHYVGSLVGQNHASIELSSSSGIVEGGFKVGGLVGANIGGHVSLVHNTSAVIGTRDVGGVAGENMAGHIDSAYSTGWVSGIEAVGGLVGLNQNDGSLSLSYSVSEVSGFDHVGGLVGNSDKGVVISSFWDIQTSGVTESAGGAGLTSVTMRDINTYLDAGWDFVGETTNGTEDLWWMAEGGYPRLW